MQPSRVRTASLLGWITIGGLWINAIWWAGTMIDRSRLPTTYDGYRYRHGGMPADWTFPTDDVVHWAGAIVIEALILSALLRLGRRSPGLVCAGAGPLCCMLAFAMAPFLMHGRVTFGLHVVALLFAGAWMIVMGIAAGLIALMTPRPDPAAIEPSELPEARVVAGRRVGT